MSRALYNVPSVSALFILFPLFLSAAQVPTDKSTIPRDEIIRQSKALLNDSRFSEAEVLLRDYSAANPRDVDACYYLALSQSLQGRLDEALSGFQRAFVLDSHRADACFEIGGILFKNARYQEAMTWTKRGLRLDPDSRYGLELAGSLSFLLDSKLDALRYWNRLSRPHLTAMFIEPVHEYSIAEEIDLKPGDLVSYTELQRASWRLAQHPDIRHVEFAPIPGPTQDQFSLRARVDSRHGIGTPLEFLGNFLGEIAFETVRFSYWNLFNKNISIGVPVRWTPTARWFQFQLDSSRPFHWPVYISTYYAWRDEKWLLKQAANGFRLRTHELCTSVLLPVRIPRLALKLKLAYRDRLLDMPLLNQNEMAKIKIGDRAETDRIFWSALSQSINIVRDASLGAWNFTSDAEGELAVGHPHSPLDTYVSRQTISWKNRIEHHSSGGHQTGFQIDFHAGQSSPDSPVEDYFLLGVGPDAGYPLRSHPVFENGRKGNTPIARQFALTNLTFTHDFLQWNLVRLGGICYSDLAKTWSTYPGQNNLGMLLDIGAGIQFGIKPFTQNRITVAFGRDLKGNRNVFYIGNRFP